MRSTTSRRRAVLAALTTLVFAAGAAAAEKLQYALTPGITWTFDNTMTMDLDVEASFMGQQMNLGQQMMQRMKGSAEVLDAVNGRPTRMRLTFDPVSGGKTSGMGSEVPVPFGAAGKTVTVTITGKEITVEPAAGIDEQTRNSIADIVVLDEEFLPKKPVDVGDEWVGQFGTSAAADPGAEASKVTFRVERFVERDGRRVAELSARGDLTAEDSGLTLKTELSGPVIVDLATGLMLNAKVDGTVEVSGKQVQQGMEITMAGDGKMEVREVLAIGRAAGDRVAAPVDASRAANPLGGSATRGLDGTWSGSELSMVVKGTDVTLTRGELVLQGTVASADGKTFSGSFTYGGESYEFSGTYAGREARLVTGGETYELTRQ